MKKKILTLLLCLILLVPTSLVSVGAAVPGATSASFLPNETGTGLCGGKLTVTFPEKTNVNDCLVYWGDYKGDRLPGYTYLCKFPAKAGETTEFEIPTYTAVPKNAKMMLVYGQMGSKRTAVYELPLPEGVAYKDQGKLLLEFQIASDLHITANAAHAYDTNNRAMFREIVRTSPDSIGLFVAGDIANTGDVKEYEAFVNMKNKYAPGLPYYLGVGNHDMLDPNKLYDEMTGQYANDYQMCVTRFLGYFTNNESIDTKGKVYYDYWAGPYHFIIMGTEQCQSNAIISDEQLAFVRNALEEGKNKACATFVLLHNSFYDTIAGSLPGQTWNGVVAGDDTWNTWVEDQLALGRQPNWRNVTTKYETNLIDLLHSYDDVFFFNGHSHWVMESTANMYEKDDTYPYIFNTASVGYEWTSYGDDTGEGAAASGSQNYFLYVYENALVVRGRNLDYDDSTWSAASYYAVPLTAKNPAPEGKILPDGVTEEHNYEEPTIEETTTAKEEEPTSAEPGSETGEKAPETPEKTGGCQSTLPAASLAVVGVIATAFCRTRKKKKQ